MARSQKTKTGESPTKAISSRKSPAKAIRSKQPSAKKDVKKKRAKMNDLNFKLYIHKVLYSIASSRIVSSFFLCDIRSCVYYALILFVVGFSKVMKQIYRDELTISRASMVIMNDFMVDILQRIGVQASILGRIDQKHRGGQRLTGKAVVKIDSRHIQSSVRFLLPGELGNHAVSEGIKAVERYFKNSKKD